MPRVYNETSEKPRRQLRRRETPNVEEGLGSKLRRRQMLGCNFRRQYSVTRLAIEIDEDSPFQMESAARDETSQTTIESFAIHFLDFQ